MRLSFGPMPLFKLLIATVVTFVAISGHAVVGGIEIANPTNPLARRVALLYVDRGLFDTARICTATPIAADVLLTAEHCLAGAMRVRALFSTRYDKTCLDDASCPRVREGVKIIAHESYGGMNAPENFDLALIKLSAPVPEGYIVTKFYDGSSAVDRNEMIIAGYGLTSRFKTDHGILRATQKLFRDSVKAISKTSVIYDQTDKKGICEGDSGGPTLVHVNNEYQVFSINSTFIHPKNGGDGCLGTSKSAYVPFHKTWIYEKLKLLGVANDN